MDQYEQDVKYVRNHRPEWADRMDLNPKTKQYWKLVKKYKTYCKDYVKALNVPFAYNLARYKNLSINELFDRNNYLPKEAGDMEPEAENKANE